MEPALRRCAVCGCADAQPLRTQGFLLPGETRTGYDVVACAACGFCYARPLAGFEAALEKHYRETRKYVYEGSGNAAAGLEATHAEAAAFIAGTIRSASPPLRRELTAVLDVGCATGQLLHLLRERGFTDLTGLDPAPECRAVARKLFGLEVVTGTLEDFRSDRAFGAVILWNVLEHVFSPAAFLDGVRRFLEPEGVLFVQLPDAARFGYELVEPFQELSVEHVNYFTAESLAGLMARGGFRPLEVRSEVVRSGGSRGAVLTAAFRKGDGPPPRPADAGPLAAYLERSSERLLRLSGVVDRLVLGREELVVWGAGAFTARLLVDTPLSRANVVAFVDSDSSLHGQTLAGRPIRPPESLRGGQGSVLVASVRWADEIRETLVTSLGWKGRVTTFADADLSRS